MVAVFRVTLCTLILLFASGKRIGEFIHSNNKFFLDRDNGSTIYEDDRHKIVEIRDCSVDVTSPYPYAVKIWCDAKNTNVRHGSILSDQAVLTTCEGYDREHSYEVVAQRIFETDHGQTHLCTVSGSVDKFACHPSFEKTRSMYYNFAIIYLKKRLSDWESISYPVMSISRTPYVLMNMVRSINKYNSDLEGCEMPFYNFRDNPHPIFKYGHRYRTLRYEQECVKGICEGPEPWNKNHYLMMVCREELHEMFNSSNLCIIPDWWVLREADKWYDGAALVCNGTTLGMGTDQIYRPSGTPDFFMVATFLRVWPWLIDWKFKLDNIRKPYVDREKMNREVFKAPIYDKNVVYRDMIRDVSPRMEGSLLLYSSWLAIILVYLFTLNVDEGF